MPDGAADGAADGVAVLGRPEVAGRGLGVAARERPVVWLLLDSRAPESIRW